MNFETYPIIKSLFLYYIYFQIYQNKFIQYYIY